MGTKGREIVGMEVAKVLDIGVGLLREYHEVMGNRGLGKWEVGLWLLEL